MLCNEADTSGNAKINSSKVTAASPFVGSITAAAHNANETKGKDNNHDNVNVGRIEVCNTYLRPLLTKHSCGEALRNEDLMLSYKLAVEYCEKNINNGEKEMDNNIQKKKRKLDEEEESDSISPRQALEELHQSLLQSYENAAKAALIAYSSSFHYPSLASFSSSDTTTTTDNLNVYIQHCLSIIQSDLQYSGWKVPDKIKEEYCYNRIQEGAENFFLEEANEEKKKKENDVHLKRELLNKKKQRMLQKMLAMASDEKKKKQTVAEVVKEKIAQKLGENVAIISTSATESGDAMTVESKKDKEGEEVKKSIPIKADSKEIGKATSNITNEQRKGLNSMKNKNIITNDDDAEHGGENEDGEDESEEEEGDQEDEDVGSEHDEDQEGDDQEDDNEDEDEEEEEEIEVVQKHSRGKQQHRQQRMGRSARGRGGKKPNNSKVLAGGAGGRKRKAATTQSQQQTGGVRQKSARRGRVRGKGKGRGGQK
uniref:Uncharacterized protein n=1 Tax=Ditylum brightwellii TaxID=49249 RepID=A0A6U3UJE5_9STRA|mmetsp:Transcript_3711/g.5740  ORF Transcript_3711/g.5740 Transcript_3711/m.5740 type:complete len:483 (+) Transcript_3711:310-1758(+)